MGKTASAFKHKEGGRRTLRVLHLEDSPKDAEIVRELLAGAAPGVKLCPAATEAEFRSRLAGGGYDLVLADFRLPGFDGFAALRVCRELRPGTPVICVSGAVGEETAVELLKAGAADYILKDRLARLPAAIERAVAGAEAEAGRRRAEAARLESEARYRTLFESSRDAVMTLFPPDWRFTDGNPAALELFGLKNSGDFARRTPWELSPELQPDGEPSPAKALRMIGTAMEKGSNFFEWTHRKADGPAFTAAVLLTRIELGGRTGLQATVRDVTELKLAEAERESSRKREIEAVGRLAGGIAHNFNNLLTSLGGNAEFVLGSLPEGDARRGDMEKIIADADKAAALTRQLLAFAGARLLEPRPLDLEAFLRKAEGWVRRLLKAGPELRLAFGPGPKYIKADAGLLEQVIAGLVDNSGEAMAGKGVITLEASRATLAAPLQAAGDIIPAGGYVRLTVSDTGRGMSPEALARIFEPFYTTKPLYKGVGLGLAVVYGAVKQSGGYIYAESVPGRGTEMNLYFPPSEPPPAAEREPARAGAAAAAILIVEDQEQVRDVLARALAEKGYTVLTAPGGREALALLRAPGGKEIQLVLADLVMPGMSGVQLAERLKELLPRVRVIYMSGYTDEAGLLRHGLAPGTPFLAKPVHTAALLQKVREVLG